MIDFTCEIRDASKLQFQDALLKCSPSASRKGIEKRGHNKGPLAQVYAEKSLCRNSAGEISAVFDHYSL